MGTLFHVGLHIFTKNRNEIKQGFHFDKQSGLLLGEGRWSGKVAFGALKSIKAMSFSGKDICIPKQQ